MGVIRVNRRVVGQNVRRIEMPKFFDDPPAPIIVPEPLDPAYIRHLDPVAIAANLEKFIANSRAAPPPNRIEPAEGGGIEIFSGYHADFLEALKSLVPWNQRQWKPDSRTWWVAEEYAEQATVLFQLFWGEEDADPGHGL